MSLINSDCRMIALFGQFFYCSLTLVIFEIECGFDEYTNSCI